MSHTRSLLFILYINDTVQLFDGLCVCKLYADNLKLYSVVKSPTDPQIMQDAWNRLFKWADTWQLGISYKKCSALHIGSLIWIMFLHLVLIQLLMLAVLDLGVLIDSNLSFAEHISHIVTKAHAHACLIQLCFLSRDTSTLECAFTTCVCPLLVVRASGPLTLRMVSTKLNLCPWCQGLLYSRVE